ncbi:hypothetical protein Q427_00810 [Halomonas sp. BC04]|nr:hypothetical protein Q427_00810 [Halomonas sp. BC04]
MAVENPTEQGEGIAQPLPWQSERWRRFLSQYQSGRLPHALLLSGPRGVGKQQFAEALIARLLCVTPGQAACGHCHGCHMLAAGYHPDLLRVSPEEGKRQIRIDPFARSTPLSPRRHSRAAIASSCSARPRR